MGLIRRHRAKVALVVLAAAGLGGGWLLLRDSSLVAVRHVQVIGLSGDTAPAIRSALEQAARAMTTLHVRIDRLRAAVSSYTVVKGLKVDTQFPNGMRIDVVEQLPVAALATGGRRVPVAADGTVVSGMLAPASVPTLPVESLPAGPRVTDRTILTELAVLDAAPRLLRSHVVQIGSGTHGLTIQLRDGPRLIFGDTTLLHAKWDAVARVLAEPSAHGATYIDVRIPSEPTAQTADPATAGTSALGPGMVPAGPTTSTGSQSAQGASAPAANPAAIAPPAAPSSSRGTPPTAPARGASTPTGGAGTTSERPAQSTAGGAATTSSGPTATTAGGAAARGG